jgi:cytochrome P450
MRLGRIIRIQPTHVSFNCKEALQTIYGHQSAILKADFYETFSAIDDPSRSIVTAIDRDEHARKRRYFAAAFAHKGVVEMEPIVRAKLAVLARQLNSFSAGGATLGSSKQGYVNLYRWINLFTFDVIGTMAFDTEMGLLEAGDDLAYAETEDGKKKYETHPISAFHTVSGYDVFWGHFPQALRWGKGFANRWATGSKKGTEFNEMVIYYMRCRMEKGRPASHRDFFDHVLVDRKGSPVSLGFEEMLKEANVLFAAGSDTSATAMTNAIYLLIKNPRVMAKLREELDPVLDRNADQVPTFAQVQSLKYLRACLDEAMRDRPPVGLGLPRQVMRPEGATIAGQHIKAGVTISVPTWTIHHDPELFPEPFAYRPERWLGEDLRQDKENLKYAVPFSMGSRACIGRNLAYFEQYLLVAMLVHRYDFEMETPDFELGVVERLNANPGDFFVKVKQR